VALYTLADLHLSLGTDKPMDVFGGAWNGYFEKLQESLSCLSEDDLLVIPGDLSWGMNLPGALPDLQFLDRLPGRKLLAKGNHDLWWDTVAKMRRFFEANGITTIDFLHNNAFRYGNAAIAGTRGWFFEEETGGAHDEKIMNREVGRLRTSLEAARKLGAERIYCFMHYPPIFGKYECPAIVKMLAEYGVTACYYGHLHGQSHKRAWEGEYGGVDYRLVAADYLNFQPFLVMNEK